MSGSWGTGRPPLSAVRTAPLSPGTADFDCELTKKLQQLETKGGNGEVLRRKLRPRNLNVEAMMDIPGEAVEGLSSKLSWWDLPEEERMARVWPGEDENGDGLDSPFSLQSGQTTPGAMTPPLDGNNLRPWTLSWVPPEELRVPGYAYDHAQSSPVSSAGPSRETTPRGPSRNLFFGKDAPALQAGAAAQLAAASSGDNISPVSFHAHLAGLRKANEAKAEALHSSLRRSTTLRSLESLTSAEAEAEAASAFKDVHLTPARGGPQKASSAGAALSSARPGQPANAHGMYVGKENVRPKGPPGHESSFNPSSMSSRPCTPPLRTFGDESARAAAAASQPAAPLPPQPPQQRGGIDSAASSASDLPACGLRSGGSQCSLSPQSSCSTLYGTPQYTRRKPTSAEYRSSPSSHSSHSHGSRRSGRSGSSSHGKEIVESTSVFTGKGFARACALFGLPSCRSEDRKGGSSGSGKLGGEIHNPYQTPPATPDIAKFKSGGRHNSNYSPATPSTNASPTKAGFGSFSLSSPSTPGSLPGAGESRDQLGAMSPLSSILGSPANWSVFSPGTIAKIDGKKKTRFSCGGIVVLC